MNLFRTAIPGRFAAKPAALSCAVLLFDPAAGHRPVLDVPYIDALLSLGFVGGMISFFRGFRDYRTYRVIQDVPRVPMRGVAMGLAHVSGQAVGKPTLAGPVSRTPCLAYMAIIEEWTGNRWMAAKARPSGLPFALADKTGKVWVDLQGASFDFEHFAQCEMDPVSAYAAAAGAADLVAPGAIGARDAAGGRCRVTEFLILPGAEYDVTGTCAPNPQAKDESDRNLIGMGAVGATFLVSDHPAGETRADLRQSAVAKVFGSGLLAIACLAALLAQFGVL